MYIYNKIHKRNVYWSSLVTQWAGDPELSLQQLGWLLWNKFDPWPRNFWMPKVQQTKTKNSNPQSESQVNESIGRMEEKCQRRDHVKSLSSTDTPNTNVQLLLKLKCMCVV